MVQTSGRSAEQAWAGQLIRQARARLGFDHRWAADMLGVSPAFLMMVESGMTSVPVSLCQRVVIAFNLPDHEAAELLAAVGVVEEVRAWQRV